MALPTRRHLLRRGLGALGVAVAAVAAPRGRLDEPASAATPAASPTTSPTSSVQSSASPSASSPRVVTAATITDARWGGPDADGDWTAAVARIQAAASTDASLTITFPAGAYKLDGGISHGRGGVLRLVGSGWGYVGGSYGTRLYREADRAPVVDARGAPLGADDPFDPPQRTRLEVYDLELHGGDGAQDVVSVFRGQQLVFQRVRVSHGRGVGLRLTQAFNSVLDAVFVGYCGRGEAASALLIDGTDEGSAAGSNMVALSNVQLEANRGTDLAIDSASSAAPTVGVLVTNLKIERASGDYPGPFHSGVIMALAWG